MTHRPLMVRRSIAAILSAGCGESGVTAVEFALLAPAFILLLVGIASVSLLIFSNVSLQDATTAAARCAALGNAGCTTADSTADYATARYDGIGKAASFSCTGRTCGGAAACGVSVVGTDTVTLEMGFTQIDIPLRAAACFP